MSNKSRATISSVVLGIVFATIWHFAFINYAETGSILAFGIMMGSLISGTTIMENLERHFLGKPQRIWNAKTIVIYLFAKTIMAVFMIYLSSSMKNINDIEILAFGSSSMIIPAYLLECMTYLVCFMVFSFATSSKKEESAETAAE
jgi:hypothetical protein